MHWKTGMVAILFAALAVMGVAAQAQDSQQKKKDQCRQQLAVVREEQQEVSKKLLELIERHGTLVMSRDRVLQEMASLEEQAWNGSLAQEETKIRTEVLGERLKKMVEAAKAADSEDEVSALLERKLSIAKAKRNRVEELVKKGTAPAAEMEDAEALVADAQLAFAQHRDAKKQSPETEEIKAITRELAEMESDSIVKQKLAAIQLKRVEELKASLLKTAEYSDLERTEDSLSRRREFWEQKLLDLETEDLEPPASENEK